jgi:hypothetical protein
MQLLYNKTKLAKRWGLDTSFIGKLRCEQRFAVWTPRFFQLAKRGVCFLKQNRPLLRGFQEISCDQYGLNRGRVRNLLFSKQRTGFVDVYKTAPLTI